MKKEIHYYQLNFMIVGTLPNLYLELCVKEFISTG